MHGSAKCAVLEAMTRVYGKTENSPPPRKYKMAKDIIIIIIIKLTPYLDLLGVSKLPSASRTKTNG